MKDLVIVGAGGFAREVSLWVGHINRVAPTWNLLGFVESDAAMVGQTSGRYKVIGDDAWLLGVQQELHAVIGIGNPRALLRISERLRTNPHLRFPNLIHPSVIWDELSFKLGVGNIICAGNVFTTDITIGDFNIFNMSSTYGHDVVIGNGNVINPGSNISGFVNIGNGCLIGTGTQIIENHRVGDGATVGAGAVVVSDIPPGVVAVGIPAKPLVRDRK